MKLPMAGLNRNQQPASVNSTPPPRNKFRALSQKMGNGGGIILWVALSVCMAGYVLPWVVNPSLSLSLGAFDLAEWVSLRLPYRPLDVMLLLRLPPVCLAMITAYHLGKARFTWGWWLAVGVVALIGVALLPPIEFFTQFRDDVNYGQQFTLAALTVGIGGVGLARVLPTIVNRAVAGGAAAIGIVCAVIGVSQAYALMIAFELPVHVGYGVGLLVIGLGLIVIRNSIPQSLPRKIREGTLQPHQ